MAKYVSYRNLPLLAQEPDKGGRPIITMENYCKWYGVQLLHPDGTVESIDHDDVLSKIERKVGGCLMGDHNFHPTLLVALGKEMNWAVDPLSLEMVTHRWAVEIEDADDSEYPNAYPKD